MHLIDDLQVTTATFPTDAPESDGTLAWDSTTLVLVQVRVDATTGTGWTYGHASTAGVIAGKLRENVIGADPADIPRVWLANERRCVTQAPSGRAPPR
jgi:hypothetical protein